MDRALRQVLAHRPMGQKVQTGQIGLISLFGTWTHGADGANRAYRYVCLPNANPGTYGAEGAKRAIKTLSSQSTHSDIGQKGQTGLNRASIY